MRVRVVEDFGAIARQRRLDLHLSQLEVAQRAGVQRQWLNRFELGNSDVSLSKVFAVLKSLEIDVALGPIHEKSGSTTFTIPRFTWTGPDPQTLREQLTALTEPQLDRATDG